MPTNDSDQARKRIEAKRSAVRDAKRARLNAQRQVASEMNDDQLAAEEARLDRELKSLKGSTTLTSVREANKSNIDTVKAQLAASLGKTPPPHQSEGAPTPAAEKKEK